tara:strand:- start:409 stop:639 length:231 start_codon:yes stop_codon:yes gene_type:complete
MKNLFKKISTLIHEFTPLAFAFLCFGITIQLIIGEPILGWDVVGNISKAIGRLGQNTFVGIAALLFLYTILNKKEK